MPPVLLGIDKMALRMIAYRRIVSRLAMVHTSRAHCHVSEDVLCFYLEPSSGQGASHPSLGRPDGPHRDWKPILANTSVVICMDIDRSSLGRMCKWQTPGPASRAGVVSHTDDFYFRIRTGCLLHFVSRGRNASRKVVCDMASGVGWSSGYTPNEPRSSRERGIKNKGPKAGRRVSGLAL